MKLKHLHRRICLGVLLAIGMPNSIAEKSTVHTTLAAPIAMEKLLSVALKWFKKEPSPGEAISNRARLEESLNCLRQAITLAPFRIDLRITAAGIALYQNDPQQALELYRQALDIAPEEVDIHSYLAVWLTHLGQLKEAERYQHWITEHDPARSLQLKALYQIVQEVCTRSYTESLQENCTVPPQAIIVLGCRLQSNGEISLSLKARLEKAHELANLFPTAKLFLCGGQPRFGQTEARAMESWFLQKGVARDRIVCEEYSSSTVENALFCRYLLTSHKIQSAVLVTSPMHLRRAYAVFKLAIHQSGPRSMKLYPIFAPNSAVQKMKPLTAFEQLTIYRDALKVLGLHSLKSFPLIDT